MTAYKFLRAGRIGPFSGFEWPVGTWVEAEARAQCGAGIHACRVADLPFWLLDELWEIELGDEITRGAHKVVAKRGRLVRRVDAWDAEVSTEFAAACVDRVRRLTEGRPEAEGHLADVVAWAPHASAAAVASLAARAWEAAEGGDGYDTERTAQSAWLAGRLGLHPAGA